MGWHFDTTEFHCVIFSILFSSIALLYSYPYEAYTLFPVFPCIMKSDPGILHAQNDLVGQWRNWSPIFSSDNANHNFHQIKRGVGLLSSHKWTFTPIVSENSSRTSVSEVSKLGKMEDLRQTRVDIIRLQGSLYDLDFLGTFYFRLLTPSAVSINILTGQGTAWTCSRDFALRRSVVLLCSRPWDEKSSIPCFMRWCRRTSSSLMETATPSVALMSVLS